MRRVTIGRVIAATAIPLVTACASAGSRSASESLAPPCDPAPWTQEDAPQAGGPRAQEVTMWPRIANPEKVQDVQQRQYVRAMAAARQALSGKLVFAFYVGPEGEVEDIRLVGASGAELLQPAGFAVAKQVRFTQALQGQCAVGVWMQLPLTFRGKQAGGGGG